MKKLLATTALTMTLAMTNAAFASDSVSQTAHVTDVQARIMNQFPAMLTINQDNFYRGDFQAKSNAQLRELTALDLYTGMGAALVPTVRAIT